jgi:hypothetical protein
MGVGLKTKCPYILKVKSKLKVYEKNNFCVCRSWYNGNRLQLSQTKGIGKSRSAQRRR